MKQNILERLEHTHQRLFGKEGDIRYFFAPGRINLIGEHLDYNGGHVLPCALDIGTYASVSIRHDNKFRFYSLNFTEAGVVEFRLDELVNIKEHLWANYPKGVIKEFIDCGHNIKTGLDICVLGTIPNRAGLSSSASIEVLMSIILNTIYDFNISRIVLAKMSQAAENKFIGVNCGIMDQFASILSKINQALLLDCKSLNYEYVKLDLTGYKLVIANTNKPRTLADSKYNERYFECRSVLNILQQHLKIDDLCDIDSETLTKYIHLIQNDIWLKRAKHVVSENMRTLEAVSLLNAGDLTAFGKLLNLSHMSLKDDFEVTGIELDTMAALAWNPVGCIGSRMTGAGFGGCTISIVKEDQVEDFIDTVSTNYQKITNLLPEIYVANTGSGAMELN